MRTTLRVGHGLDVHAFAAGRKLVLGGVEVPSDLGLKGHSDADVVLHALIDAVLGAAGLPDIGQLFPDTDAQWKGASSLNLLKLAWTRVSSAGWQLVNADISILAQKPRLAPFIPEMKRCIAEALSVTEEDIGIKATTTERLGFVGREEGMCASAVVLLESSRGR